jgi:glyoxylase-like metal-dependent hydrolase (beta-lactamase superfamily II)
MVEIATIKTPSLGDRSYLVTDGTVALVVDPQRDIDRVLALTASRGIAVTHVFETHIHNDYLTGGLALARATGAAYHVNGADEVAFDRVAIADGDEVDVGDSMRVRVIATPGHTFTHLAYALEDTVTGAVVAVFTGGSLLHGSTGRPDLLGAEHAPALAAAQHASARRLATILPGQTVIYPTHGFGSFCAASLPGSDGSTIGEEHLANPALTLDEDTYVAGLLAGLDDYPAYYARMAPLNAAGPQPVDLAPLAVSGAAEIGERISAGEWVVDLRDRRAFASGHVPGSLSFAYGDSLVPNLGWLLPPDAPLTLIGDSAAQVADAQRDLARIGIDRIEKSAGPPHDWAPRLTSYPVCDFAYLAAAWRHEPVAVLDVRRRLEWSQSHIEGALHVPLHHLPVRIPDLPPGPIWVHCQAGYRASIAASILHAAGREVTAIDDDYHRAAQAGLPLITAPATTGAARPAP